MIGEYNRKRCDKHPKRIAPYTVRDRWGHPVDMCEKCRVKYCIEGLEYLICKHCGIMVRSEDDTRAKYPVLHPHHPACPRSERRRGSDSGFDVEEDFESDIGFWTIWEES